MSGAHLKNGFRKLSMSERRAAFGDALGMSDEELAADAAFADLADVMTESSVGVMPVPMGVAQGFLVDGTRYDVPLATEEPSVVAAATYAARIVSRAGGFTTGSHAPVMTAQVFLERDELEHGDDIEELVRRLSARRDRLEAAARDELKKMETRGGGFQALRIASIPEAGLIKLEIDADVRNAMGANLLNTVAERLKAEAEQLGGGTGFIAILTNAARSRRAWAEFRVPISRLGRSGMSGPEVARRIELASRLANTDRDRAVTHNKGVMNGITALALATANDTRAIEAAAHAWAGRHDGYRSLTDFTVEDEVLCGTIELPLAFATVGGAVSFHPYARRSLKLLGHPDAPTLSRIAAAVGLAQNFAAIYALVSEGIQHGHMRLHAARVAYSAGARGDRVREVGEAMWKAGDVSPEAARRILGVEEDQ